jgi:CRISPR system Cascade subunit CasA
MVMNLISNQWLPVRRRDGQRETIRPAEIASDIDGNPVVAVDWPRPDFRVATLEFLIGLVATACPPAPGDDEAWIDGWEGPPSPERLAAAFAPLAHAFDIDGSSPRFLQDLEDLPGEPESPETLLIEAPGDNTRRKNTALLVKPDRITRMALPAAAMSLFTLQCYAPSGGRGNLTSLRGGGPLTALVFPDIDPCPLWHLIWANVPAGKPPGAAELSRVFPWLAPTRTADRFPATTPREAHPLQAFWGMPRRIRLDFAANPEGLPCDLTGAVDPVIVTGWRQRPNGVKYVAWDHPLSPSYKDAKGGGWLPVHPQPGGIGYRHWVGIAFGDGDGTRRAAPCVADWHVRSQNIAALARKESRLLAAGYDMDNMKARSFVESEMPLFATDAESAQALAAVAGRLVAAAETAAQALRLAVRDARFGRDAKSDSAPLAAVYEDFWAATHYNFFTLLREPAPGDWEARLGGVAHRWRDTLRAAALRIFDEAAPLDPFSVSFDPRRIVAARRNLAWTFGGYGARGTKLFEALLLASPEAKARRTARSKERAPS